MLSLKEKDNKILSNAVCNFDNLKENDDLLKFAIKNPLPTICSICRKSKVTAIGGFRELGTSEDYDFHIRLVSLGVSYVVVKEPLVVIRVLDSGRTLSNPVDSIYWGFKIIDLVSQQLPNNYKRDLAEQAAWFGSCLYRLKAQDIFLFQHLLSLDAAFSQPLFTLLSKKAWSLAASSRRRGAKSRQ